MNVGACEGCLSRQYAMAPGSNSRARDAVPWMQMLEQKKNDDDKTTTQIIKNKHNEPAFAYILCKRIKSERFNVLLLLLT